MLAKTQNKLKPLAPSESLIMDGMKCVQSINEKYIGATLTQDLLERIAVEAFVRGRLSAAGIAQADDDSHLRH